jgi:hypothetical protein
MPVTTKNIVGNDRQRCELPVSVEGLRVTVGEGAFKMKGKSYYFEEQHFIAMADPQKVIWVGGYLVEDAEGKAKLLIDEVTEGESSYAFDGPYTLLHWLFHFDVPAGATSLEEEDIKVRYLVAPPPEDQDVD